MFLNPIVFVDYTVVLTWILKKLGGSV